MVKPGIPYLLFYLFPVCDRLFLFYASIGLATVLYVLYYLWSKRVMSALGFVFTSNMLWLFAFITPPLLALFFFDAGLQPGRLWLWFRPWGLSFTFILASFLAENKWLETALLALAYHFHPPMAFPVIFYKQVYEEKNYVAISISVNALAYILLGDTVWSSITCLLASLSILLADMQERGIRLRDLKIFKLLRDNRLVSLIPFILLASLFLKPFPYGPTVLLVVPPVLYAVLKYDIMSLETRFMLWYAVLVPVVTPSGFTLPFGRFVPLIYLFLMRELDDRKIWLFLLLGLFSYSVYLGLLSPRL